MSKQDASVGGGVEEAATGEALAPAADADVSMATVRGRIATVSDGFVDERATANA